jgi:hypothetical protein
LTKLLALVVEGESDVGAIPILLRTAGAKVGAVIKTGGQATECTLPTLVEKYLLKPVRAAILKDPEKVIVVLDREDRTTCPGQFATAVLQEIQSQLASQFGYMGTPAVVVVCADRKLENWLIADPAGLARHAHIRHDCATRVGAVADGKDALSILRWAYKKGTTYHKRRDAPALAKQVRTSSTQVRRRSKSLDKLLREAGA